MDFEQVCSRKKEVYLKKIIKILLKKIRKHSSNLHQIIKICHDDIAILSTYEHKREALRKLCIQLEIPSCLG